MEAIHPKASKPIELSGVNIRLKNAFEPGHKGTLISKNYKGTEAKIEIITGTKKVSVVEIHDPSMVGAVGFDLAVMEIFKKHNVSYILKTTNASLCFPDQKINRQGTLKAEYLDQSTYQ